MRDRLDHALDQVGWDAEAAGTGGCRGRRARQDKTLGSPPGQVTAAPAADPALPLAAKGGRRPAGKDPDGNDWAVQEKPMAS